MFHVKIATQTQHLADNGFLAKYLSQPFLEMKTFTPSSSKILYLLSDALYWATQRPPGKTSCL